MHVVICAKTATIDLACLWLMILSKTQQTPRLRLTLGPFSIITHLEFARTGISAR